ncbi:tyrosine-type recombinase/integrase [Neisseria shayeganii]|uniref:Integrase arm-type DNA-binding domain-containing protein n=1 Tax=Neisseria shayeganii TaxID=607712 RepID=A0A7D7SI65_9NEIS|nr:integrase arm-type DNA-binding domain-containing protein [Neisseria shayeganii]QMT41392.1 integrase arm-type DNA-binding domain-containing protein [Neisseria shayeganii]
MVEKRTSTKLTDAKLRNIAPGSPVLTSAQHSGLQFQPSAVTKGIGTWYLRYYDPDTGKRARLRLGNYPAISLAEAEDQAKRLTAGIKAGISPVKAIEQERIEQEERLRAAETAQQNTFTVLTEIFYERQIAAGVWKNERYRQQWLREIKRLVFPGIGKMPITEIKALDIVGVLEDVWHKTPDTAGKLIDRIGQVFTFAEAMGYCEHNPTKAARVALGKQKRKPKSERHFPSMPWQDLPRFVADVLLSGRPAQSKVTLLFLIINAARSGAIRLLQWSEIDFRAAMWKMEADAPERKTYIDRFYPLPRQAVQLLHSLPKDTPANLVFPMAKPNKHGSWAMSDMTLTKLLREHSEGFHSDRPDKGPTVHGFRASFKNWATEHGYDDLQSEIQLAHDVGNDVYQSYMRSAMIEKRRQMMQAWADYLFSAVAA